MEVVLRHGQMKLVLFYVLTADESSRMNSEVFMAMVTVQIQPNALNITFKSTVVAHYGQNDEECIVQLLMDDCNFTLFSH